MVAAVADGAAVRAGFDAVRFDADACTDSGGVVASFGPADSYTYLAPVGDCVVEPVVCTVGEWHVVGGTCMIAVVIWDVLDDESVVGA